VAKYGKSWHPFIRELILDEWKNLFKNYPNLPTGEILILPEL
jgi:hypothetical protein